ncbi:MAG: HNH endonuclease [Vicinamibacterales bacterium]
MSQRDQDAIALAERVLAILGQGGFSATYKFALFTAILDLCIEKTSVKGIPPESLTTRQLAEKVVELYWNQVSPFAGVGTLRQGGARGEQAEIVWRIARARERWADAATDTPHRARREHSVEFGSLLDFVEWKLIEMPIPRLQVLGRKEERFLYEYNWTQEVRRSDVSGYQRGATTNFDNRLLLRPGVAEQLVRLNGILRPLFYRKWAVMVARMNALPEAELEQFLFGAERIPLDPVRQPLRELQENRCFYCDGRIAAAADVDHFIPWSRYRDDGLDNLVVAHPACNNSKRDFLASAEHVQRWACRTRLQVAALDSLALELSWPRNKERSLSVGAAIYLRLPAAARLWQARDHFVPVDRDRIREAFVPDSDNERA